MVFKEYARFSLGHVLFWEEEFGLSKRFLKLFALIAVFTLVMAGSAFAATIGVERTWRSDVVNGSWTAAGNWVDGITQGVPKSNDIVVFPNSAREIIIDANVAAGAIRIDSGADQVKFTIAASCVLEISSDIYNFTNPAEATFTARGNAIFTGAGRIGINTITPPASPADSSAVTGSSVVFNVSEGKKLQFDVIVSHDNANVISMDKLGKGTVAFTALQDNKFNPTADMRIRDGEVAIARSGHMNGTSRVIFDTMNNTAATAMLTTTWTGENGDSFTTAGKILATTNGTINVAGTRFILGTVQGVVLNDPATARTITKTGSGELRLGLQSVWGTKIATTYRPSLAIAEGNVFVNANNALSFDVTDGAAVPVTVADGTRLILNNTFVQNVNTFGAASSTSVGSLEVREGSWFVINGSSTFPGYITGAGSIQVGNSNATVAADPRTFDERTTQIAVVTRPTVAIYGRTNDYTGDTRVTVGSILVINHEHNLGGTTLGKIYLEPQRGYGIGIYPAAAARGATLQIAERVPGEGFTFILPNEIYVGEGVKSSETDTLNVDILRNTGEAEIAVPINGRLEVANNVTFNANVLGKVGQGDIVFSSLGYDSIGNGSFVVDYTQGTAANQPINGNPPAVTTALHIWNGLARIENERVAVTGDIIADTGGFPAGRPILSIRNGLKMPNAIRFTDQSTFQTELIDANLAEGTNVQSAVEVGHVSCTSNTNNVYNRVTFDQLTGGTISKGDDFQLMKATTYTNYTAAQVIPTKYNGQGKAPFDPYFSNVYLYFKATHNIDVPVIGTPSITSVAPDASYSITIPVTSTTGLKVGSATLNNLPGAAIMINGDSLVITGKASATEQAFVYRVSVTTQGSVPTSTLEFEGNKDLRLTVTSADIPDPTKPTLTPVSSAAPSTVKQGNEVVFTVDWSYKDASGTIDVAPASMVLSDIALAGPATLVDNSLATDGTYTVLVNADATNGQTVSLSLKGAYAGLTTPASVSATVNDGVVPPTPTNGGSSGCDAGFAGLALLLAAPLFLRKKD